MQTIIDIYHLIEKTQGKMPGFVPLVIFMIIFGAFVIAASIPTKEDHKRWGDRGYDD